MLTPTPSTSGQPRAERALFARRRFLPLYCATNGCATRLVPALDGSSATCPICDFTRLLRTR